MLQTEQIVGSAILAAIPAMVWGYIFFKKQPEDRKLSAFTFLAGALAVFPILLYKLSWDYLPWINAFKFANVYQDDVIGLSAFVTLPLSVVITFMIVGVIEEIMKMIPVHVIDQEKIRNIDDSIEFFIIAALGFAFTENILYFYSIWVTQGPDNLLIPFLFRSSFSTFAHLMFSGILGYYYGIANFADEIFQEEMKEKRGRTIAFLHKITGLGRSRMFHHEKMLEGLLLAVGLHAIFNILLEINMTFVIVPFLVAGYITLNYLFYKKENHKVYRRLLVGIKNHTY